jgi:uncharacterized protein YgiM (DUF1202 family)
MTHLRLTALVALAAFVLPVLQSGPASARGSICDGTVRGLSRYYDPDSGSGFLALRTGPSSRYAQIGELFNGNHVEIYGHRGSWLKVYSDDVGEQGWVHGRWVRDNCPW